ncbi:MAG: PKD domain-containing protein [Thermoplasmata archaeon]|nr:PKD domain-containing protein [Thermoplasmata archaeon]
MEESRSRKWIIPSIVAVIVIVVVVAVAGILMLGQEPEGYEPPIPDIDVDMTTVYASIPVHFDASGSYDPDGEIISYEWFFGDGTTDSGEVADHAFDVPGEYEVSLRIRDNDDNEDVVSVYITVENDISLTITDSGWGWLGFGYYWLDISMTNHGNYDASTDYIWFEVEVWEGGAYAGADESGNSPDTLTKDSSASWTVYFDIPIDEIPKSLSYSDLGHLIEVDI